MVIHKKQNSTLKANTVTTWKRFLDIRIFFIVTILILLPVIFIQVKRIYLIGAMILLNALTETIKRRFFLSTYLSHVNIVRHISRAIEFSTIGTVLAGFAYGPGTGMLAGFLGMTSAYAFERKISKFTPVTVPLYMAMGYAAWLLRGYGIVSAGIILTIAYNILMNLLLSVFFRANFVKLISFSALNLLFNIYMFTGIAYLIVRML